MRQYEDAFATATPLGQCIVIRALMNCGDQETLRKVNTWLTDNRQADVRSELEALKKHLADPKRQHVRDRPARTAGDLDLPWGNFCVTGEYAPIARILEVIESPDNGDPNRVAIRTVAAWSFFSNLEQHPRIGELLTKNNKNVKNIQDLVDKAAKEGSKDK